VGGLEMFQKLILTTNPVTEGSATALIEVGGDANDVAITTLDGEYHAVEEFEAALNETMSAPHRGIYNDKIWGFFPMTLPDAHTLLEALMEALQVAKEA